MDLPSDSDALCHYGWSELASHTRSADDRARVGTPIARGQTRCHRAFHLFLDQTSFCLSSSKVRLNLDDDRQKDAHPNSVQGRWAWAR